MADPVKKASKAGMWALKIFATVAVAMLSAGIVVALAARYSIPFITPASAGGAEE